MTLVNTLKKQVDLPVWEWLRFAPGVSSAVSAATSSDNSNYHPDHGRYIYYLIGASSFWRYDTWTDAYLQLASPPYTPTTASSLKFVGSVGYNGRVISAGTNNIVSSTIYGKTLKGYDIRIISGTGAGQQRVITDVSEVTAADTGIATGVSVTTSTITLTDSTKNWTPNQWVGYQLRAVFGSGITQVRKILSNSATALIVGDVTFFHHNNLDAMAPLAASYSATAGSQTVYTIESATITVDSNWAVQPDSTSQFMVQSGGVYLYTWVNGIAAYYSIAEDVWYYRSTINVGTGNPTDITIERLSENATMWDRGIASSGTTTSLIDTSKNWTTNQWNGYYVRIFSGTGENQLRQITSNTDNTLNWTSAGTAPDTTSRYFIEGLDAGTASSGTSTTLTDSSKNWATNRWAGMNVYITNGTSKGESHTIISNTATALTVSPGFKVTPDNTSQYRIQGDNDKIFVMYGGQASMIVHQLDSDTQVLSQEYDYGSCSIGTATKSGSLPVAISSITRSGTTATVSTVLSHSFKTGDTITHAGATGVDASLYNISATITVTSNSQYTYTMAGTPGANATFNANSTTVLVDASKNWTTNQWAGYICYMNTNQTTPGTATNTSQAFRISSNTANTLTFVATGTAPTNGVTRYSIGAAGAFGSLDNGLATGTQSTTTIQDTNKNWVTNIYAGRRVKFTSGTGFTQEATIASNTSNTLTLSAAVTTAAVSGNTTYSILGSPALGTGINLNWAYGLSDSSLKGKYLITARGGAVTGFIRYNFSTGLWEIMSTWPQTETFTTGSMYSYDGDDRLYFTKETTLRVYYLDLVTMGINGAGVYPYIAGAATIGNRMEIFQTADGLKYLWLNRHSNTECFRALLFY